jgi:hypothetical protein
MKITEQQLRRAVRKQLLNEVHDLNVSKVMEDGGFSWNGTESIGGDLEEYQERVSESNRDMEQELVEAKNHLSKASMILYRQTRNASGAMKRDLEIAGDYADEAYSAITPVLRNIAGIE